MDEYTQGLRVPFFIFIIAFVFTGFIAQASEFLNQKASENVLVEPAVVSAEEKTIEPFQPIPDSNAQPVVQEPIEVNPANIAAAKIPVRLTIPKINLNSDIVALGKDELGNMDVPSGDTNDVGWYKYGPMPGDFGTAVLDAHVFAAFENLDRVRVGDRVNVEMNTGEIRTFEVEKTQVYKLSELDSSTLFGSRGVRGLNLITCAGKLTPDRSTYTHRLIVFTKLVE